MRAKVRLVARGFDQREGIDFFDTFFPCPSVISIRLLAALACELDLDLCHFDAEQAFVQSDLDEDKFNDWGGRGCNIFVPILGGNGTKIAPTGDIFDQSPGQMR